MGLDYIKAYPSFMSDVLRSRYRYSDAPLFIRSVSSEEFVGATVTAH